MYKWTLINQSNFAVVRDEAECSRNEILIQDFEACIQLPDKNDEATEIIIVVN